VPAVLLIYATLANAGDDRAMRVNGADVTRVLTRAATLDAGLRNAFAHGTDGGVPRIMCRAVCYTGAVLPAQHAAAAQ